MVVPRRFVRLTPFIVEIDGAKVYVLEIVPKRDIRGKEFYFVTVLVEWNGVRSKPFTLHCYTNDELITKLRAEIAKLKLSNFLLGEVPWLKT